MAAISDANYSQMVKQTLAEKWREYRQPLRVNDEDLTAGMILLAKIAAEAVDQSGSATESDSLGISAHREISLEAGSLGGTVDKIKKFVENNAYAFHRACEAGFPFSLLKSHPAELALKQALDTCDSILSHFLTLQDHWMTERELDERFGVPFQRLEARQIAEACFGLKRAYVRNKDNKAGYYLLWLVKQATGCVYEIPEKSSFDGATVAEVLSDFFAGSASLRNAANFVEILFFRRTRLDQSLYQEFLDREYGSRFLNFAVEQLVKIPMDKWPSKACIIGDLLETVEPASQSAIARALASSRDPKTSEVGNCLLAALAARSLREAVPHFYALKELLLNFNYTSFEIVFGRPFVDFCHSRAIYKKDPEFTKRLSFSLRKVVVEGSLMMGVYDKRTGLPPYLLAYDMNTEKLVWGIPLTPATSGTPAGYFLKRVGERTTLQFVGEKTLHFIHPETGDFDSTLELPEAFTNMCDRLHIGPQGFGYQMVYKDRGRILIGGRMIDKRWHSSFEVKTPSGIFHSFSTHCGFQQIENRLVLFGPTGDQIAIEGCIVAEAQDDKLYSIEKDPVNKDKCLLRVRTLKSDNEVVSGVEKSIPLNLGDASFGKVCQNGQLILFSQRASDTLPIFVDLHKQEVTYSEHKFPCYGSHVVNADAGELWTWDPVSYKIWKVSSTHVTLMGSMESSPGTTFLHVDKAGRLYFVDI